MTKKLPVVYLARHGETAWSLTGQHTGLTDLPLTEAGECNARRLAERLKGMKFEKVLTSTLQRAVRTCSLAGFGAVAEVDRDWSSGIMAPMRAAARPRFFRRTPIGIFSGTAARAANHPGRCRPEPTGY